MRWRVALAVLALGLSAGAAAAADLDPGLVRLNAKAEACVRAAIPEVEGADPNLASAAKFILDDLCAVEISRLGRYEQGLRQLEILRNAAAGGEFDSDDEGGEMTPAQKIRADKQRAQYADYLARAKVDPETGGLIFPDDAPPAYRQASTLFVYNTAISASPELRALTARLLLEARLARKP